MKMAVIPKHLKCFFVKPLALKLHVMHNIDLTVPGNNMWGEQECSALCINNTASKNTCLYCLLSTLSTCVFVLHVFKAEC